MDGMENRVVEYLDRVVRELEGVLPVIEKLGGVRAVVVFGSAVRPEDFVPGVSDVDVLVIASRPGKRYCRFEILGSEVNVKIATAEEVRALFELGDPLAFMLYKSSRVLRDDGVFESIFRAPRVTEHTSKVLRTSIFAALGLALEAYFWSEFRRALSHACHSLRHLARYEASLREVSADEFPIWDREVIEALAGFPREVFIKVVSLRKRGSSRGECAVALDETMRAIALELSLKAPGLSEVERAAHGRVTTILAREADGTLALRMELETPEGFKRLEVGKGYVREIESLLA